MKIILEQLLTQLNQGKNNKKTRAFVKTLYFAYSYNANDKTINTIIKSYYVL